jgi:hypothetical protein
VRGREDDQVAAHLLDRLGARALMHLAGSVQCDLLEEVSTDEGGGGPKFGGPFLPDRAPRLFSARAGFRWGG